jgi:hypothetical protein
MRKTQFAVGEIYHIFNRGVDKREIFKSEADMDRFLLGMKLFNNLEPAGSIYEQSFVKEEPENSKKLVKFVTYALNKNHYHFAVEQLVDKGIEKLMHRLGVSQTNYFNLKYKRTGSLFGGKFKDRHIDSNEYLLHLSVYINLNFRVHQLGNSVSKLVRTSWWEYIDDKKDKGFCDKDIILDQFENRREYQKYAEETLLDILEKKKEDRDLENLLLE